jgi:hypothetical protein
MPTIPNDRNDPGRTSLRSIDGGGQARSGRGVQGRSCVRILTPTHVETRSCSAFVQTYPFAQSAAWPG